MSQSSTRTEPNKITLLENAVEAYPAMLQAISGAKSSIKFANFCMRRGKAFDQFFEALVAAAKRGVEVNLLLDAYGSKDNDPQQLSGLAAASITITWFRPWNAGQPWRYNYRFHKKLLIVDETIGFTGGIGVGDFWLEPHAWRDLHFRIEGPLVQQMCESYTQSQDRAQTNTPPHPERIQTGQQLTTLVQQAETSIIATSAFFGPPRGLRNALITAAKRGARVQLIVNSQKWVKKGTFEKRALEAGRHQYGPLLKAGVEIYEYQPTFTHAKITIVDSKICEIGSANLNSRSFHLDEEFNLQINDPTLAFQLTAALEQDISKSRQVKLDSWEKRPFSLRAYQAG